MLVPCAGEPMLKIPLLAIVGLVPCAGEPMLQIPLLAMVGLVLCAGEHMLKIPLLAIVGLVPCAGEPMLLPCAGEPMQGNLCLCLVQGNLCSKFHCWLLLALCLVQGNLCLCLVQGNICSTFHCWLLLALCLVHCTAQYCTVPPCYWHIPCSEVRQRGVLRCSAVHSHLSIMTPLRVKLDTDVFVHPVWDSGPVVSANDLVSVTGRVGERSLECANICVQCSGQYCTVQQNIEKAFGIWTP
jgi:hypothetical protein